mgnify:CR=1 FL=1
MDSMRLSQAAELAVRGMVVLAEHHGKDPVPLADICRRRDMAREYLVKIFALLARAGIVIPIRGKRGGYTLARCPEEISLLEVIEAVEGPISLNLCQHDPPQCDEYDCPFRPVWADLQDTVRGKLGAVTLADALPLRNKDAAVEGAG